MKKNSILFSGLVVIFIFSTLALQAEKLVSYKTHFKFYSHTSVEDIEANNYAAVGTIDPESGVVVFSVPMQGFEFEKALMQKHFNSGNFLNTKKFPKAKLKAQITNLNEIDFTKDGIYPAMVEGDLTIKGVSQKIKEKGTVTVKGNQVTVDSKFNLTLVDYGISFVKGKPSTNVAKTVEVTVKAEY
ncbi:YceI family protein [Ancylomarina longa]|uniref:YceI family protein n=1 Tax=Ancylomarina longa TaxID=2487017 RepID=A0A434AXX0_9BACT|nr:YceI family protein [Ancylomarina longa]RUT79402.1 YceI family protein [Ancylomarina longa]